MILKNRHFKTSSNTNTPHMFESWFFFFLPCAGYQEPWPGPHDTALLLFLSFQAIFEAPREHVLSLPPACLQAGNGTRHNHAAAATAAI